MRSYSRANRDLWSLADLHRCARMQTRKAKGKLISTFIAAPLNFSDVKGSRNLHVSFTIKRAQLLCELNPSSCTVLRVRRSFYR